MLILDRTLDPNAANIIARMTVRPPRVREDLINDTIRRLKDAHIWPRLDVLFVGAAHTQQASQVNWGPLGSTDFSLTNSPTFVTDRGWYGDAATSYIDTGFSCTATTGRLYAQNDAHLAAVMVKTASEAGSILGLGNQRLGLANTGAMTNRLNSGSTANPAGSWVTTTGVLSRSNSSDYRYFRNGVAATQTVASIAATAGNMRILAGGANFGDYRVPWASIGGSLTDAMADSYTTIINDYCSAVGAL